MKEKMKHKKNKEQKCVHKHGSIIIKLTDYEWVYFKKFIDLIIKTLVQDII